MAGDASQRGANSVYPIIFLGQFPDDDMLIKKLRDELRHGLLILISLAGEMVYYLILVHRCSPRLIKGLLSGIFSMISNNF